MPKNMVQCALPPKHISCVLRCPRISFIQHGASLQKDIFLFIDLRYHILQDFFQNFMDRWWFLYQIILKTTICYFHNLFSSSDKHQHSQNRNARRLVEVLLLFVPSVLYIFYTHRTNKRAHHSRHHKNNHHTIFLIVILLQTNWR